MVLKAEKHVLRGESVIKVAISGIRIGFGEMEGARAGTVLEKVMRNR